MVPINISEEKLDRLSRTFGCSKGSLPFTYLGLPLSLAKPKLDDFLPVVNKFESRLANISSFLSQAGRLEPTNSVFTALPTYCMSTLLLPPTIIKQIDTYRKHYHWKGGEINARKPPKAAWPLVCKSKKEGGLCKLKMMLCYSRT